MAEGQNDKLKVKIADCLEVSASGRFAISVVAVFGLLFGIGRVAGWW